MKGFLAQLMKKILRGLTFILIYYKQKLGLVLPIIIFIILGLCLYLISKEKLIMLLGNSHTEFHYIFIICISIINSYILYKKKFINNILLGIFTMVNLKIIYGFIISLLHWNAKVSVIYNFNSYLQVLKVYTVEEKMKYLNLLLNNLMKEKNYKMDIELTFAKDIEEYLLEDLKELANEIFAKAEAKRKAEELVNLVNTLQQEANLLNNASNGNLKIIVIGTLLAITLGLLGYGIYKYYSSTSSSSSSSSSSSVSSDSTSTSSIMEDIVDNKQVVPYNYVENSNSTFLDDLELEVPESFSQGSVGYSPSNFKLIENRVELPNTDNAVIPNTRFVSQTIETTTPPEIIQSWAEKGINPHRYANSNNYHVNTQSAANYLHTQAPLELEDKDAEVLQNFLEALSEN